MAVENSDITKSAVQLIAELDSISSIANYEDVAKLEATQMLLDSPLALQAEFVRQALKSLRTHNEYWSTCSQAEDQPPPSPNLVRYPFMQLTIMYLLLANPLPFQESDIHMLLDYVCNIYIGGYDAPRINQLVKTIESFAAKHEMTPDIRTKLGILESGLYRTGLEKLRERVARLWRDPRTVLLVVEEPWASQALNDINALPPLKRACWGEFLNHCSQATGAQPTGKWLKTALSMLNTVGYDAFKSAVVRWFPLLTKTADVSCQINMCIMKGLVWCCALNTDAEVARCISTLAQEAYKSVQSSGPKAGLVGNACIYALGAMPGMDGIAQLAVLKLRIRNKNGLKLIEKALAATAQRLGVSPDEIEEMTVPTYGLSEVGYRQDVLGEYTAELKFIESYKAQISWIKADGKQLKSPPVAVKAEYATELSALKSAARDCQRMLPAQRDRIDRLFTQSRTWNYAVWRERYLDHPLVGVIARRLIWRFSTNGQVLDAIWLNGRLVGMNDEPFPDFEPDTVVQLWHPINQPVERIVAWRSWLVSHQIRQPFKQAHREVYILTDAERQTNTYSNRYAAHIVKQHQFNALCAVRGWHNVLKVLADADFPPPSIRLPQWGVRAELWTDGMGDNYESDTNATGAFLCLTTDQVRFLPLEAPMVRGHAYDRGQARTVAPIPLEQVPPIVFSEVMRDIDLFVGVASVGNDPAWVDGGPEGRFRDYWQNYSFGELSATAETRKQILTDLLPRLKIKERCTLEDRFLVVRGDLHTYKIHLGSGNILMSPADTYLCIVTARSRDSMLENKVFLPFEGDQTLSIILSKAFLLAADTKITDPTIVHQIRR